MHTFLIERNIPNAGSLSDGELRAISKKSCSVLDAMDASKIKWLHSYVTGDKIYCVYKAAEKKYLEIHAREGEFPIDRIIEINSTIGPSVIQN